MSAGGAQLLCVRLWGAAARLPHSGAAPPPACDDTAPVTAAPAGAGAVELILDGAGQCAGGGARYRLEYTPATAWDITLSMVSTGGRRRDAETELILICKVAMQDQRK